MTSLLQLYFFLKEKERKGHFFAISRWSIRSSRPSGCLSSCCHTPSFRMSGCKHSRGRTSGQVLLCSKGTAVDHGSSALISACQGHSRAGVNPAHRAGLRPLLWNHNVARCCINNLCAVKHFQLPSSPLLSSFFLNVQSSLPRPLWKRILQVFRQELCSIRLLWHDCCILFWLVLQTVVGGRPLSNTAIV